MTNNTRTIVVHPFVTPCGGANFLQSPTHFRRVFWVFEFKKTHTQRSECRHKIHFDESLVLHCLRSLLQYSTVQRSTTVSQNLEGSNNPKKGPNRRRALTHALSAKSQSRWVHVPGRAVTFWFVRVVGRARGEPELKNCVYVVHKPSLHNDGRLDVGNSKKLNRIERVIFLHWEPRARSFRSSFLCLRVNFPLL